MPIYIIVFLFLSIALLLGLATGFLVFLRIVDSKEKSHPLKGTIIAKVDLFNRMFLIEPIEFKNRRIIQNYKIVKGVNWKKWNPISLIINRFSPYISKGFAETFNKLEKGSTNAHLGFDAPSFYIKNRNVKYDFYFNKIASSRHFLVRINYNHIMASNSTVEQAKVPETTRQEIASNTKLIKGFVAFNIDTNINKAATRFRELIQFKNQEGKIAFLRYNAILVFVIFGNKKRQIKKITSKIQKETKSNSFYNELKYLYKGSAIAKTKKITTIRHVNQILKTLNFLAIYSMKTKLPFLSANKSIDRKRFKTYNQALRIFENIVKNKTFEAKLASVRNISNNKPIIDYLFPSIKNINSELFSWIISDMKNEAELQNAFAEKLLFSSQEKPIIVDVNDTWLSKHMKQITNKKALVAISFRNMEHPKTRLDLMRKASAFNIAFALYVRNYNDSKASLLKLAKPRFVIVDDNIWTKGKLLSSDYFTNLISLNALAQENQIKIIYKNPSLMLDKKIYSDIGLKYYFQT